MAAKLPSVPVPPPRIVPSETVLYTDIQCLVSNNDTIGNIFDAAMLVKGNIVEWVGKREDAPADLATSKVSLAGSIVVPGLINTHHHQCQSLTRCIAKDHPLFDWLSSLYPSWATMTSDDVHVSALISMAELILSGCTTTSDHLYIYPNDVTLDDTIRAAREIGMRFHPTRGIMTLGKSKGGLPPDNCVEELENALADAERLVNEFHDPSKYSMLRMGIAPCSPFTVSKDCMIEAAKLARKFDGVRLHTHLAENEQDIEYSLKTYNCRPGEYIKEVGWSERDCWFAHCVKLSEEEMEQFAENGIGIAHCPSSNCRLASGICPVREMLDLGVNVGLGVDGSASNDSGNLLEQGRWAMMLQRGSKADVSGLKIWEAFQMLTKHGAKNLGREDIGELSPGFAADFVGWKTKGSIHLAGGHHDPLSAVLLCTPGPVDYAIINGEMIVDNARFTTINVDEAVAKHNAASKRICAIALEGLRQYSFA